MRALLAALLLATAPALAGDLPDLAKTPGSTISISVEKLCATKWGLDKRHVTTAMKERVFAAYGIPSARRHYTVVVKGKRVSKARFEVDHLISRELGGADEERNLWPEDYTSRPWNAHLKDRLENRLHKEVCERRLSLVAAQTMIRTDWTAAYRRYFGNP